ncbi:hypothetical protein BDF14DRAFT_97344 [Spinellus fusiger]|nr:hypothetical protein BDF14DRAFT_97344 [Spinellus fusiger]
MQGKSNGSKASLSRRLSRFNTLAWGHMTAEKPSGIIVGGMESGELELWDPSAILNNQSADACLISRSSTHTGTIRGLDFNPIQTNLLASVGSNNEVYIWDLSTPNKPHNPGAARSNKLDDITSVGWNNQVAHILATSSTTGYTVVWDLRSRKEVMSLSYTGQHAGNVGRRGTSAVAWHPDAATQLVAASEDDNNPIITLWDLRHAHSPEKTLSGHQKGITGVSWCQQDADLLMSCSKDCRTLCWNPRSGELLGELSQSSNWTFQAEWCPRNPDLLASASFDGKITVCSLQGSSNNESAAEVSKQQPISNDPFDTVTAGNVQTPSFALTQPPKWLRKPVGASFGFGGKLVVFNNKAGQASQQAMANLPAGSAPTHQVIPRTLAIQSIVTDPEIVQRSNALEEALNHQTVTQLIDERHSHSVEKQEVDDKEAWEVLRTLFAEDAREQLMKHLGFDKSQAAAALAAVTANKTLETPETVESVSEGASPKEVEETPAITQDKATEESQQTNEEKTDKLSGLFQISDVTTPEEEFFAKAEQTPLQAPVAIPSAIIPAIQREALKLYPADVSETDTLITRSIVLGDFESAVQLCLDSDRLSDALLLAICSGGDLLAHTQKVYFERQAKKTSYLRLLESIMSEDLSSVVETVTLDEWTSVVAVLCTFAQTEQFGVLCETLGDRLQQAWDRETAEENSEKKQAYRRHATLCYLASGNLQKVAAIWITEQEEENSKSVETGLSSSLQKLIEKVTVFRQAIAYEDKALEQTSEETSSNDYPLARLYNKYCEYAELLATQGKLSTAQKYIDLTPTGYQKSLSDRLPVIRDRVYRAYAEKGSAAYTQTVFPFTSQHLASGNEGQSADTLAAQGHEQQAQLMSSFGTHVPSATAAVPATMTTQYTTPSYAPSAGNSQCLCTHQHLYSGNSQCLCTSCWHLWTGNSQCLYTY